MINISFFKPRIASVMRVVYALLYDFYVKSKCCKFMLHLLALFADDNLTRTTTTTKGTDDIPLGKYMFIDEN